MKKIKGFYVVFITLLFSLFFASAFTDAKAAAALSCGHAAALLASPSKAIEITFCLKEGAPTYTVRENGQQVLGESRLGLAFQGEINLDKDFALKGISQTSHQNTWEQIWGEEKQIKNQYNELRVELTQAATPSYRMILVFRAYDDGIAFRYEVPRQPGLENFVLMREFTDFAFTNHQAWWIPAYKPDRYEQLYQHTPLAAIEFAHTPLTIEGDNAFYAVHEAGLDDYTSMTLKGEGDGRLSCDLVPWADGTKVKGQTPLVTPWRTIQIGRRAIDLLTSHLILNLNEPNRLADTSWIHPQKYIGIWWALHIGKLSWGTGPLHGATTERTKTYIDFAKTLKIPAVLVEGWNKGWDDPWGDLFDFTHATADFDLQAVTAYAANQDVQIIGHHETGGAISNYERQVDEAFKLYRKMGIRIVKTGYVGARVEGNEWHHGQFMVRHHRLMAEKAAAHGIMLDIHEPIKDTGLRRTFPNVMTREGGRGAEWDAWDAVGGNPPNHTTIIPFTRGLSGPFDFTPGIFDLLTGQKLGFNRVWTTLAKQLALYVVIYSPLQMAADLPENYIDHPAFKFIQDVAVDWERTVAVNGEIGAFVTIARKARDNGEWFLGSITNEEPRRFDVSLDFLESGRSFCAEIYGDKVDTHYITNPLTYEITHLLVTKESILKIELAAGGGQAIRLAPAAACRPNDLAKRKIRKIVPSSTR
jgi:alpha-glucosidase